MRGKEEREKLTTGRTQTDGKKSMMEILRDWRDEHEIESERNERGTRWKDTVRKRTWKSRRKGNHIKSAGKHRNSLEETERWKGSK